MAGLVPIILFSNSYFSEISFFKVINFLDEGRFVAGIVDRIEKSVFGLMIFGDIIKGT